MVQSTERITFLRGHVAMVLVACIHFLAAASEDSDGAHRVAFIVKCAAQADRQPSEISFQGLFDGERIAGSVTAADCVQGDFLCTRLFTFWGAPKVKAAG